MESKNNDPAQSCSNKFMLDSMQDLPSRTASLSSGSSVEDMNISDDESAKKSRRPQRNCQKYNLRTSSLKVRVQVEEKKQQPKPRKPKSRPPPLSKYRRRSANARERLRMSEINDAFEVLKQALPEDQLEAAAQEGSRSSSSTTGGTADVGSSSSSSITSGKDKNSASKCSKNQPTKIAVLKLAMDYIAALRDVLGYDVDNSSRSSSTVSSYDSNSTRSNNSSGGGADHVHDDLGSDAASTSGPSTSSGDEESLMSSEELDIARTMEDLNFLASSFGDDFAPDLGADFSPDLSPDFTATFSPDDEMCLELAASVL